LPGARGNEFQLDRYDDQELRHKQQWLAARVRTLMQGPEQLGADHQGSRAVVGYTQASADQLRLTLDGGWHWTAARKNKRFYSVQHRDVELSHRDSKSMTVFTSLSVSHVSSIMRKEPGSNAGATNRLAKVTFVSSNEAYSKKLPGVHMIKNAIHKSFRFFGFDVVRFSREQMCPPDFEASDVEIVRAVRPWTMTSVERIHALIHSVSYISDRAIPGAIVECGVWKGGSMAAVARTLLQRRDVSRDLYLFDTFAGMTDPNAIDVDYLGKDASEVLRRDPAFKCANAPLEEVKEVLYATGYPRERIHFIAGKVEDTIPSSAPSTVALLRLDTDWYASTMHELLYLFPLLSQAGVIIIDDYGHWKGSRQACDEYFAQNHIVLLLNRIDYTGRIALKP
jgi:hypothetical protein